MSRLTDCYEMVSELMDKVDDMTDWENGFVLTVADYEDQGRMLTDKEMVKVEELHDLYCS